MRSLKAFYCLVSLFLSLPSQFAWSGEGGFGFSIGGGLPASDKGLYGAGIEYQLPTDGYLKLDTGVDFAGFLAGVMYKHPLYKVKSGDVWYQRCLFIFECESEFLIGAGLKHFQSHSYIRTKDGQEAEFHVGSKYGAGATITQRLNFTSGIFLDMEFSYRAMLNQPEVKLVRGQELPDDRNNLEVWDNTAGAGVSLGYRF